MKIQLVNEKDEAIGVKERSELDYSTDIYRISALWLTNSEGKVLLAKRAMTKDKDPGKWGAAVVGTIEENETYDSNIYKEASEEIGLEGVTFTKGPKIHITSPRNCFCQWYFATVDRDIDSFTLQAEEVDEVAWIDPEQLKRELRNTPEKYTSSLAFLVQELGL